MLGLRLTSLDLGGRSYPLDSDEFKVKGPNKAGETVGNAVGAASWAPSLAAQWAAEQAAPSVRVRALRQAPQLRPRRADQEHGSPPRRWSRSILRTPITVDPVSQQEAARLAQGLYPGGPTLYRRGPYGSPYYGYAAYPMPIHRSTTGRIT